jgi:glucokinase
MSEVPTTDLAHAELPLFLGVDVGGTGIKIGVVDNQGRSLAKTRIDTLEERGPQDAILRVRQAADGLLANLHADWNDVAAVGLGTPGTMDIPRGLILTPPNLPHWRHFPIRDKLAEACQKPVWFANDANAAAYGEYWVGSGRHHSSMIMLTLGTGVGGGIIVEGMSVDGVHSFGSECGHIIVDSRDDARLCAWGGGRGELEAYASATAVVLRARELLQSGRTSSLARRMRSEELTALMIAEEANAGDPLALEIIDETARYLGIGIVTLVHAIDPGLVVLGGAMDFGGEKAPAGRRFLDGVRQEFRRRAFDVVANSTVIAFAKLGSDAGYIGAAGIARAGWLKQTHSPNTGPSATGSG